MLSLGRVGFQFEALVGVQRRQVVEHDFLRQEIGVVIIDRLDAQQREVAFVLLRRADLAGDDRPGAQTEAANLARRDVDVVRAGEVVVIRAAQETETVGEDFQRAFAVHQAVLLDPFLEDLEDQVLFLESDPFLARISSSLASFCSWTMVICWSSVMYVPPRLISS